MTRSTCLATVLIASTIAVASAASAETPRDDAYLVIARLAADEARTAAFDLEGEQRLEAYRRAYALAVEAHEAAPDAVARLDMGVMVARRAWDAEEWDAAETSARAALAELERLRDWPPARMGDGSVIHHANGVLGLLALRDDDVETAVEHLLASTGHDGAPTINSFGPNMTLAAALIERGRHCAVLDYLERCQSFWKMDRGRLERWSAVIVAGGMPDFGANLVYGP